MEKKELEILEEAIDLSDHPDSLENIKEIINDNQHDKTDDPR